MTHILDTSDLTPQFYWLNTDRIHDVVFEISTTFHRYFVYQIPYSNFWVDRSFQASVQTLFDIRLRPISLKFPSSISLLSPNIPTYIYSCAVVQTLSRHGDNKFV